MNKENNLIIGIVVAVFVIFALGGTGMMGFGSYGWMMGMMNGNYSGFGFMWIFGWLIMILTIIVLVLFIIWLFKKLQEK